MISIATQYSGNHKRIRHFMSKVNFLIQKVEDFMVNLVHLAGIDMPADILTKALASIPHNQHTSRMLEGSLHSSLSVNYSQQLKPAYEPTMPLISSLLLKTQTQSIASPIRNVNTMIPWPQVIFTKFITQKIKWKKDLTYSIQLYSLANLFTS